VDYRRLRKLNFEQKNNKIYLREDIMNKKILSVVVLILFSTFSFAITVYAIDGVQQKIGVLRLSRILLIGEEL